MQIGMIGLGRMGSNMVRRLMKGGHTCVVYDRNVEAVQTLTKEGATGTSTVDQLASQLKPPRAVWLMVPAAVVESSISELSGKLQQDDVVIDGGNSYYIDDIRRSKQLAPKGIHLSGCRHQWRCLGIGARLLHDDRRRRAGGKTT